MSLRMQIADIEALAAELDPTDPAELLDAADRLAAAVDELRRELRRDAEEADHG